MNKAQRIVIVAGLLFVAAMVAYTPWSYIGYVANRVVLGEISYRLLNSNPLGSNYKSRRRYSINEQLIFYQFLGLGFLPAAGYVGFGAYKRRQVKAAKIKEDDTN